MLFFKQPGPFSFKLMEIILVCSSHFKSTDLLYSTRLFRNSILISHFAKENNFNLTSYLTQIGKRMY